MNEGIMKEIETEIPYMCFCHEWVVEEPWTLMNAKSVSHWSFCPYCGSQLNNPYETFNKRQSGTNEKSQK
jgi:rRNA maturation endonuclease Nob1